jgi:hypothetical protein
MIQVRARFAGVILLHEVTNMFAFLKYNNQLLYFAGFRARGVMWVAARSSAKPVLSRAKVLERNSLKEQIFFITNKWELPL